MKNRIIWNFNFFFMYLQPANDLHLQSLLLHFQKMIPVVGYQGHLLTKKNNK